MSEEFRPIGAWDTSDDNPRFVSKRLDAVLTELRAIKDILIAEMRSIRDEFRRRQDDHEDRLKDHEKRITALEIRRRRGPK